jgi:hypothetical protein
LLSLTSLCSWDIVDRVDKVRTRTWQLILDSLQVIPTPSNDDLVILPAPAPQAIKRDASPSSATGSSPMKKLKCASKKRVVVNDDIDMDFEVVEGDL